MQQSSSDKLELTESQRLNRAKWQIAARGFRSLGDANWRSTEPTWGLWSRSEEGLDLLPKDMNHMVCLDAGCGTGYILKWMNDRGAIAVGIDPTDNQLLTAHTLRHNYKTPIHLVQGFAEQLPFADSTFDFAISEYGAVLWADPYEWIPEISRVLKPNAGLVLYTDHMLSLITDNGLDEPDGEWTQTLQRSYFDVRRMLWNEDGSDGVEYHLMPSEWISLFRRCGLSIEAMYELPAPKDATSPFSYASAEWGRKWPAELVWKVRKLGAQPSHTT